MSLNLLPTKPCDRRNETGRRRKNFSLFKPFLGFLSLSFSIGSEPRASPTRRRPSRVTPLWAGGPRQRAVLNLRRKLGPTQASHSERSRGIRRHENGDASNQRRVLAPVRSIATRSGSDTCRTAAETRLDRKSPPLRWHRVPRLRAFRCAKRRSARNDPSGTTTNPPTPFTGPRHGDSFGQPPSRV